MSTINLVLVNDFCTHHQIEFSFIHTLNENGLIEITSIDQLDYISTDDLPILEKWSRLYVELGINVEGIETIHHLLERIGDLQQEVTVLRNRLGQFED
ncbi:MAG: chaperone modulator CbpM [Saprospiraceae bacterium]|nr:chaperone modulator CbpM [Saprospiraceae bacterium]